MQEIGQRQTAASCLVKLGQVCRELGRYVEARQYLRRALAITAELRDGPRMLDAAINLALLLAAEGEKERALELAILIKRYPVEVPEARERVSQLPEDASQLVERRTLHRTLEGLLAESYL